MSLDWLHRVIRRRPHAIAPAALGGTLLLIFGLAHAASEGGLVRREMSSGHRVGTVTMFSLLTAYLLAMLGHLWRRTEGVLVELAPLVSESAAADVRARLLRFPPAGFVFVFAGIVFGLANNHVFVREIWRGVPFVALDVLMIAGACLLWSSVAFVLSWRLPVTLTLARLARGLPLDLYRLDRIRPLARLATTDLLAVAGAMAFMPLQSLDAEFRLPNYRDGLIVGIGGAVGLALPVLLALRANIRERKGERLSVLRDALERTDRGQIAELELATAHVERIRTLSSWPIDLALLTRIVGYVILPPCAWVAAALVENLVDQM